MSDSALQHLCVTHSPLVTHIFQAAMRHLNVPADSVSSISRRSVKPAGKGLCLDELSDELESSYKRFHRTAHSRCRAEIQREVRRINSGREFIAYLPHLQRALYQEIAAHPDCRGYRFIEEGFTSMDWQARQTVKMKFGKRLQNSLRTWWTDSAFDARRPMFDCSHPKFCGAVSISPHAFTGMPGVVNVSAMVPRYPANGGLGNLYVVLDTSYLHREIRWEAYRSAVVAAIAREASGDMPVRVKFHFADESAAARFESLVADLPGQPLTLLEPSFSIEEKLSAADRVLFAVSSLGYYAAIFGANVKCFAPDIAGFELGQWVRRGLLPPNFAEIAGLA